MIHADIILVKKKDKECVIMDAAVPADSRTWSKEKEKIDKYTELAYELKRILRVQTRLVLVVI